MSVNIFLSILAGFLSALSFNFPSLSWLIFFSLSPLFFVLYRSKKPYIYFFIAAIIHYAIVFFWLGFVTRLGTFLLVFYLALYWAIFAYLARVVSRKYSVIVLPVLWIALELLRENIPALGFSWAVLGYSQFRNTFLIQIADIAGVEFISFIIITVNVIIADCWASKKILRGRILYGGVLFVLCFGYSLYTLNAYKPEGEVRVSIIQPGIPQELKWQPYAKSFILGRIFNMGRAAERNTLVIYPEAVWPGVLNMKEKEEWTKWVDSLNRDAVIGAVTKESGKFYNAALFVGKNGRVKREYRKIKLVPFGEYIPLRRFLRFISVFNTMGDISPGSDLSIFKYKHKKFAVLICFEDSFPRLVSDFSMETDFLVNITNDAWFKGEPQASQHLSIMTFRAIENRISIARSANTGISGYVDFLGHIHSWTKDNKKVFVSGVSTFSIPLSNKRGIYSRTGNYIYILPILAVLVYLLYCGKTKKSAE